jgi:hypothetical protein
MAVSFRLRAYLEAHGVTPYRLAKEAGVSTTTIYNLVDVDEPPTGIKFETLDVLLKGLINITGKPVEVSDIIGFNND